jgi:xanthine dehydrogenase YagS FAD-binding subunit
VKVRDRASYAFALVSAALVFGVRGERIADARVAFGGVGTKPWRSVEVEQALEGRPATRQSLEAAAGVAFERARTTAHNAFKVKLAQRALALAFERAMERT